jgi:hypothetical protein
VKHASNRQFLKAVTAATTGAAIGPWLVKNVNAQEAGKGGTMMLATTQVESVEQFLKIFSTKGAEKRKQHGSKGAVVFRDPNEANRVWVLFDWDEPGFKRYVSDPAVPPILQEAGHKGKPQTALLAGNYSS